MEELDPDWEIQEHLPEESGSKVNWIVSKGLGLGKKILISGIVLSSAPLVLPPLVVISALGFAVSVPYGVFLASYVCSEGLMSKLLPGPPSHLSLLYNELETQEEKGEREEDYDMVNFDMEKEEEEQLEDVQREVKMRIGMDEENEGPKNDQWIKEAIVAGINAEQPIDDVQGVVLTIEGEEKGIGKPEDKDTPVEHMDVIIMNTREEGGIDRTELEKETRGLIETIRDEGKAGAVDENKMRSEVMPNASGREDEAEAVKHIEKNERDVEVPIEAKSSGEEGKKKGKKKDKAEEEGVESGRENEAETMKHIEKNERDVDVPIEAKSGGKERKKKGKEKDKAEETGMEKIGKVAEAVEGGNVDDVQEKDVNDNVGEETSSNESVVVPKKHPTEPPQVVEGGNVGDIHGKDVTDDGVEDTSSNKSTVVPKEHPTEPPHGTSEEYTQNATITANGTSKISEAPMLESGGTNQQKHEKDPSEEVITSPKHEEEKIWQQIEAMRTIVGYKAAPQASCIDELKALYIFTGVEPPATFKDQSDLKEVNDKLKFLMSVVGVK